MNKSLFDLSCRIGFMYQFAAIKRDAEGNVVSRRDSEACPNLFTNYGVDNLFRGPMLNGIFVGTGNTPPTVDDLYLAAYLAKGLGTGYYWNRYSHTDLGSNLYEAVDTLTYTFPTGVATGIIAEVGVSFDSINGSAPATTKLASRALVVDGGGSPTTFEVLSDEELQLTIFARKVTDYTDRVSVHNVGGVDYTVTCRPYALSGQYVLGNSTTAIGDTSRVWWGDGGMTLASPISGDPSSAGPNNGGANLVQGAGGSAAAYVDGTKSRTYTMSYPAGTAYKICGLTMSLGHLGSWQVKIDPPLPKSALQKFIASFTGTIDNTP